MAQTLQIKRSTTTASPTALANGELAYSADSSKLFIGRPGGGTGDIDAVGGKYYTDIIAGATSANTASKLVLRDGSGNFSAGTITATISGNVTGALTGNASTATILQTARTIGGVSFNGSAPINLPGVNTAGNQNTSGNAGTATAFSDARTLGITGDIVWTSPSFDGSQNVTAAGTLATVNSNVGTAGSTTSIPVITVNAKGLVTAVTTASIATSFNIAADSGTTNALDGGETLTISGGTGVSSVVSANEITLNIGQAVATTSNVTFNNVVVDGTLSTDDIQASTLTASGDVIVEGDLTVNGTTTTVNSNTVNIGDAMITLNSDEAGTPSQDAGLEVERGTSTNTKIYWDESAKYWVLGDGDTPSYARILTAASWGSAYTGAVDGGTF
tara:strand:+ start:1387 stop:2550 length:1164 start_codon:yes stop_codon:yes gene_type:complete